MSVNKFAGTCHYCAAEVPANGGKLWKSGRRWLVAHLACAGAEAPAVTTVRFGDGETYTRNARGRCEDAPCCGCCTI